MSWKSAIFLFSLILTSLECRANPPKVDPEFLAVVQPILDAGGFPRFPVGDVQSRRAASDNTPYPILFPADVQHTVYNATASDGYVLAIHRFSKTGFNATDSPGPAVYHIHGGNTIEGSIALFANMTAAQVSSSGVPHFSVDYRLAPEHPFPTPLEDCYSGLVWVQEHASELGIDKARIAVRGESAGAGLAVGVLLLARDRRFEPPVREQILVYPMLNDSNVVDDEELMENVTVWTYDDNKTCWGAYLGKDFGTDNVSEYAAPARMSLGDARGLPSAYVDVGEIDIFRNEARLYAEKLAEAGVLVEFHLYKGVPHGFDGIAPNITVTREALANRTNATISF